MSLLPLSYPQQVQTEIVVNSEYTGVKRKGTI